MTMKQFGEIEQIIEGLDLERIQKEAIDEREKEIDIDNLRADLSSREEARKQLERNFVEKFNKAKDIIDDIEDNYLDTRQYEKDKQDGLMDFELGKKILKASNLYNEAIINLAISYTLSTDTRDAVKEELKGGMRVKKKLQSALSELSRIVNKVENINTDVARSKDIKKIMNELEENAKSREIKKLKRRIDNLESDKNYESGEYKKLDQEESEDMEEIPYCPACGVEKDSKQEIVNHYNAKKDNQHSEKVSEEDVPTRK